MHGEAHLTIDLTIAVAGGLLGALAARALRLPVLAGYLAAGLLLGPSGLGVLRNSQVIEVMAELGVTLLMFAIGVELSLAWLARMRRAAFIAGPLQILTTVGLGVAIARWLEWAPAQGLVLGFVLALSSTMVVVKGLSVRGELQTRHAHVMVAVLVIQDLAAVLMVAALPMLTGSAARSTGDLLLVAAKGIGFIVWIVVLARWLVPAVMKVVARSYSKEVFVATAAALCLGGAASGYFFGFSVALGAFAAGLVISESEYGHEVLADVTPLRDLFGMVFFVSLGLLSDVRVVARHLDWAAVLLLAVFVGKPLLAAGAAWVSGQHTRTALAAGLGLAQIGEFSFLVATLAWQRGLLSDDLHTLVLAVATLSLFATPFLMSLAGLIHARTPPPDLAQARRAERIGPAALSDHVILAGYGRVGSRIGELLAERGHRFVVVDYDQHIVAALGAQGVPVLYGDASRPNLLEAAGAARARLAVVTLPEGIATRLAVRELRRLNSHLPIIARAHSTHDMAAMRAEGASQVIYAEFEAALAMLRETLLALEHEPDGVQALVDAARQSRSPETAPDDAG